MVMAEVDVGVDNPRLSNEIGRCKLPVDQFVDYSLDVVKASVLVIEVIGVLPYIHGQKWVKIARQRRICIAGFDDDDFVAILCKPCPATAKLGNGGIGKFLPAVFHTTKRRFNSVFQYGRRFSSAIGA